VKHDPDVAVARQAARHHGLVTAAQAKAFGLNRDAWYRRLRSGQLLAVHPGIARHPAHPVTPEQRILAAVLAAGPGALASHASAAHLWGAASPPEVLDVLLPGRPGLRTIRGCRVHRPADHLDLRPSVRSGIPCVNPLRVVVDIGAVASRDDVEACVSQFLVAGLVSWPAVVAALGRHQARGHHGIGVLRSVVDGWSAGDRPPDSVLEVEVLALLRRHGVPEPAFQHPVDGYVADMAWPAHRVILEIDGWNSHGGRRAFERDRERSLTLAAAGWTVLHVTWLQVKRQPALVARRVQDVLARRSAA
jgi:very-short-patch-repair endonuclease